MTFAKFYVKILRKIGRPQLRRQATVRPSFRRALGPVSVRRRSAAQGCANAHTDAAAPGDGRVDHVNAGGGHDTEDRGSLNDE